MTAIGSNTVDVVVERALRKCHIGALAGWLNE
jgi:hypothetical protein